MYYYYYYFHGPNSCSHEFLDREETITEVALHWNRVKVIKMVSDLKKRYLKVVQNIIIFSCNCCSLIFSQTIFYIVYCIILERRTTKYI